MHTIMGSSGKGCVLIMLFQLYDPGTELFEGNLLWVGQYDSLPTNFILEEDLIHY